MSRLLESICIIDGEPRNLKFHQKRVNRSRQQLYSLSDELRLEALLASQKIPKKGKFKCRILYGADFDSVEFIPYTIRRHSSFRLVHAPSLKYPYKLADRRIFQDQKKRVREAEIILAQNHQITDASYANLVFFDGKQGFTPSSYLLNGTMRQSLLSSGKIQEKRILSKDLKNFTSFKLINAMINLEESPLYDIQAIFL